MARGPDSLKLERHRDNQQWILDWIIKETGREQNLEYDMRRYPREVKSHAMIAGSMFKWGFHCETIARAAEERGHRGTAARLYFRAIEHYAIAEHSIFEDDNPNKVFINEHIAFCTDRVIALNPHYPIERVEIPWEGVSLAGLFHKALEVQRAPTVLYLPGMDMIKEQFPDPAWNPFAERGMHVLSLDGPGQGISNLRKIRITADNYERAASAAISYLASRPEVDPDQICVVGTSMGSYWAYRTAALDGRVRALATAAACHGGKRHIFEMASPRFKQIFMYMAGIHDEEEFNRMAAQMHLRGYGARIHCPCLVTAGEFDPLTPLEDTLALFDELAGPKELWVLENDFHGTGRVHARIRNLGEQYIHPFLADWLLDALAGRLPADLNRRVLVPAGLSEGPYSPPVEGFTLSAGHK